MAKVKTETAVRLLKEYALQNYEKGMDAIVECWPDEEYETVVKECDGLIAAARAELREVARVRMEQFANARIEAGV